MKQNMFSHARVMVIGVSSDLNSPVHSLIPRFLRVHILSKLIVRHCSTRAFDA